MKYIENRGSEWRKWDLHVHTPESGMSNKFGNNWDEYVNGPLEFSFEDSSQQSVLQQRGIKQHVCDILEGGDEAFRHREQKYAMKWISPI